MDVINLDYGAIGQILKNDMRGPIDELAAKVAARVDVGSVTDAEVTVTAATTDRAKAYVTIAHPAGLAIQAKYGALTKAAASLGLEVHGGGDGLVDYVSKSGRRSRITAAQAANYSRGRT